MVEIEKRGEREGEREKERGEKSRKSVILVKERRSRPPDEISAGTK